MYIACRSMERGEKACREIIHKSGNSNVFVRILDLASFASIRKFAERLVVLGVRTQMTSI